MTSLTDWANKYDSEGLSIFPLPFKSKNDKTFKWGVYQQRRPTKDEIKTWFNGRPSNIAVVCGGISGGLVVVEFDVQENYEKFNEVFVNRTGNTLTEFTRVTKGKRGPHVWLRVRTPVESHKFPMCEIRSEGNYIVVPPSVHPEGHEYKFLNNLPIKTIDSLLEVGIDIKQAQQQGRNQPGWVSELLKGVGQGSRNDTATKLAGYFRHRLPIDVTEHLMLDWNTRNSPPLPTNELLTAVNSVYRYPEKEIRGEAKEVGKGDYRGIGGDSDEGYVGRGIVKGVSQSQPMSRTVTKRDIPSQSVSSVTNVTNVTQDIIRTYLDDTDGQWVEYRDLDNDIGIRTPEQKTARRKIISRLISEQYIEKHPSINTKIRRLKSGLNRMALDFNKNADYINFKWPFGIEEKVDVYPKSLIVTAGTKDAGKTAFCLNAARKNADMMKVHYFNSEMGDVELMNRLRNFEDYKEWVPKVDWIERATAFEDVIFPDDFNIIDFLEVTTEFYLVSATLTAIYQKLNKGVVLVALQKDPKSQYGRGGAFSVEKARLYITLNHINGVNTATIESGKMWHNTMDNPRGQFVNYKIVKGCIFTNITPWKQRNEKRENW